MKWPVHPVSAMIGVDLGMAASLGIAGLAGATGTGLLGKGTWGSFGWELGVGLGCTGILTDGVDAGIGCLGILTNEWGFNFSGLELGEVARQCSRIEGRGLALSIRERGLVSGIVTKGMGCGAELGGTAMMGEVGLVVVGLVIKCLALELVGRGLTRPSVPPAQGAF